MDTFAAFQEKLKDLISRIETKWAKSNDDLDLLPGICAQELEEFQLNFTPDLNTLIKEMPELDLPIQNFTQNQFSDYPLTLVRSNKLLADIYFWYKSDTSIHNHHFCGAFKVIAGESFQINYEFKKQHSISEGLDVGELIKVQNKHLKLGAVQSIKRRDQFIHHVFHIGKPTVTLCIRTPSFQDEALAAFIYPKYRITLGPLTVNQLKWLHGIQMQLEESPGITPEVPWTDAEVLLFLYRAMNLNLSLKSVTYDYLKSYLLDKKFLPDFFELSEAQTKINLKVKMMSSMKLK